MGTSLGMLCKRPRCVYPAYWIIKFIIARTPRREGPRNLAVIIPLGMESILPISTEEDMINVNFMASFLSELRLLECNASISLNLLVDNCQILSRLKTANLMC